MCFHSTGQNEVNAETSSNPYETPAEVDDSEWVDDRPSSGTLWRPNQPGKVACFWILGWTAFHAVGTLWVSGLEAVMDSVPTFMIHIGVAIGLYLSVEMVRKLTVFGCAMWVSALIVGGVLFLILSAMNRLGMNGPELTFAELNIFGTTLSVSAPYMIGIMAFMLIAPGYLLSILWGRRCNGKPVGPGIFSSFRNGGNSRESHHGKRF